MLRPGQGALKKRIVEMARRALGRTYVDSSDEFINWLLVTNAGMQHRGNVFCFEYAIRRLPSDAPVVEIGAHAGLSTNIMCYLLRKYGRTNKVISIDPWIVRGYLDEQHDVSAGYLSCVGGNQLVGREAFAAFVRDSYVRNVRFFSGDNLPYAFHMTSDVFFRHWDAEDTLTDIQGRELQCGGPIAFGFIDGNHDRDYAQRDFEQIDRNLRPGGLVLFDNSEDDSPFGSAEVAKAIERDRRYTLVVKNPNRLFQKR